MLFIFYGLSCFKGVDRVFVIYLGSEVMLIVLYKNVCIMFVVCVEIVVSDELVSILV